MTARTRLDPRVEGILDRALAGCSPDRAEACYLLDSVAVNSLEMAFLTGTADLLARRISGNLGEVFGQVGVNGGPCSDACDFCVLRSGNTAAERSWDEVQAQVDALLVAGANSVSLMATSDYPWDDFLALGREVRERLPADFPLVCNITDFDDVQAAELVAAGFTAMYHVIRLREGIDTRIPPERRRQTLLNGRAAGLDVTYCLEPIGPEHTHTELVDAIFAGREFEPTSMATMRRIAVPGVPLSGHGQITEVAQAKVQAVTVLVASTWPGLMMLSAHEPSKLLLRAGANRVTAEAGSNPRDEQRETAAGRAWSVQHCRAMLTDCGYELREGPSPAMQGPLRQSVRPAVATR